MEHISTVPILLEIIKVDLLHVHFVNLLFLYKLQGDKPGNACPAGTVRMDIDYENTDMFKVRYREYVAGANPPWNVEQKLLYDRIDSTYVKAYG